MRRRTLNEILPLSQIIYVIVKNNLKCIFFMSYWQRINFFSWIEQWKVNIYQMIFCVLIMFFFPTQIWDTLLWGDIIFFIFIKHYICSFLFFSRKLFIRLGGPEVLDSSKVSRKLIIISRMWTQHKTLSLIELKICLSRRTILFANKQTFLIHDAEKDCSQTLYQLKKS